MNECLHVVNNTKWTTFIKCALQATLHANGSKHSQGDRLTISSESFSMRIKAPPTEFLLKMIHLFILA